MNIKPFVVMVLGGITNLVVIEYFPNWEYSETVVSVGITLLICGYLWFLKNCIFRSFD